ncbi:MAG: lipopolysaccharide biosynthesis protein [Alcanivoracaceae bacterium]
MQKSRSITVRNIANSGAIHLAIWYGIRIILQLAWIIALARAIGAENYGIFAGMAGMAIILGNIVGSGYGTRMIQMTAHSSGNFPEAWSSTISAIVIFSVPLAILYALIARQIFPDNTNGAMLASILLAELVFFPLIRASYHAFQATKRMSMSGATNTLVPVSNLFAVLFFYLQDGHSLTHYLIIHCATASIAMIIAIASVHVSSSLPLRLIRPPRAGGFPASFSIMAFLDSASEMLDKAVILALTSSYITGIYAAAHRLAVVASSPIHAATAATLPSLFQNERHGLDPSRRLASSLLKASIAYGLIATMVIWALAPYLPIVLGSSFEESAQTVQYMALVPLGLALQYSGGAVLVAEGKHKQRILLQAGGIVIGITLLALLAPGHGMHGIVAGLYSSIFITATAMWGIHFKVDRKVPHDKK